METAMVVVATVPLGLRPKLLLLLPLMMMMYVVGGCPTVLMIRK